MSTYPGENPQTPDDGQPQAAQPVEDTTQDSSQDSTEPTAPVGYWERQATERAQEQAPGQVPPTTAYPQNVYGQQNPYPMAGQPPYGGQPAASSSSYYYPPAPGGGPGQPPYGYAPPPPPHPQATLSMVLGLVGLVGAFFACGLTLFISPFAWVIGQKAVREIQRSQGRLGGESQARTGMFTGIIGTVLLVLGVIALVAFLALMLASDSSGMGGSSI